MQKNVIYRCKQPCYLNKKCFIIKTENPLAYPITVLQKCPAKNGTDISILIGDEKPP